MNENKIKKKLINHLLRNGKKQLSEKIFTSSVKFLQKMQKKSHSEVLKQTILNSLPIFRTIELKKTKPNLEIPVFLPSYAHRMSRGLKHFIQFSNKKTTNRFYEQLGEEVLLSIKSKGGTAKVKDEFQKNSLQKKKYFKYYRW